MVISIDGTSVRINVRAQIEDLCKNEEKISYFSVGSILRTEAKIDSPTWTEFKKYLDRNILPPDEMTNNLILRKIKSDNNLGLHSLMSGCPRNRLQYDKLQIELKTEFPCYFLSVEENVFSDSYIEEWSSSKFSPLKKYYPSRDDLENYITRQIELKRKFEEHAFKMKEYKVIKVNGNSDPVVAKLLEDIIERLE